MTTRADRAWQRMLSGRRLDLLDPSPLDVEIADIAHGLARVARWNGQTEGAHIFSVAQHTLLVEAVMREHNPRIDDRLRLAALLHDAPEYVIGDMISPFKAVIGGSYKAIEKRLLAAIHIRFGLPAALPASTEKQIKNADKGAAYLEATRLAGFAEAEARRLFGRDPGLPEAVVADYLMPWPATKAEKRFLARFKALALPSLEGVGQVLPPSQPSPYSRAMIHVCSLADLHPTVAATGASHVLTVMANVDQVKRPPSVLEANHLRVSMDDIAEQIDGMVAPSAVHVDKVLDFVRRWDRNAPLVIHCYAGISRSTASAFAAACALNPNRDERLIAQQIRKASPSAFPNRLIVKLADAALRRNGRMLRALDDIGPGNMTIEGRPFRVELE